MKLGTFCNWNIPVTVWYLSWTGHLMRLHMKKQKTELPPCALVGGHTLWDTVARSPQSLWTTHLRLLSIKDISSQYWSGHISSKWHFVNRERRKKKKLWFLCLQGLALEVLGFIFSCCFFLFICLNKFTATRVGCGWSAQTLYAPLASRMLAEMLWACVMLAWQHFQCHC